MKAVTKRKRGTVTRLLVELDVSQVKRFEEAIARLGMSKVTAIAAALNIWLNMVEPREGE